MFSSGKKLKIAGVILSILIGIVSWYMILVVAALLGETKSNVWAAQFIYSFLVDQLLS